MQCNNGLRFPTYSVAMLPMSFTLPCSIRFCCLLNADNGRTDFQSRCNVQLSDVRDCQKAQLPDEKYDKKRSVELLTFFSQYLRLDLIYISLLSALTTTRELILEQAFLLLL